MYIYGYIFLCITLGLHPPPPPVSKNHLTQEPTPGSAVKFSHHFFYQGSGFFMFLVDVGQLFRCAGHHFMCVTMGPPIMGDPISHSQAHSFVNVVNCGKGEPTPGSAVKHCWFLDTGGGVHLFGQADSFGTPKCHEYVSHWDFIHLFQ